MFDLIDMAAHYKLNYTQLQIIIIYINMNKLLFMLVAAWSLLFLSSHLFAYGAKKEDSCQSLENKNYTFSWPLSEGCDKATRGGSSEGAKTQPSNQAHTGWLAIREKGLSKKELDRRAILAMAGEFRVDFNFLETVGFSENYDRDQPYYSWGTELVYVVTDEPDFISLQHIMVMYFDQDDGTLSDPFVMKHWRQDWTFEDDELLTYDHRNQWSVEKVGRKMRKGTWSQAVFQVDDSPRYESYGKWQHNPSFSTWVSALTSRPLPRREYSVRDDYQVLSGYNRHTIHRFGWVQEEENWKQQVAENGDVMAYVAKEEGIGRYSRIEGTDFEPGRSYMEKAGPFWQQVRNEWKHIIETNPTLKLHKKVDGKHLFMPLFGYASEIEKTGEFDAQASQAFIKDTLNQYVIKQ